FGVAIPQGFAALLRTLPEVFEDGDNELPEFYRPTLHRMYQRMLELREDIDAMTREVGQLVKNHSVCSRLTALEGVGPIGAMSLHATIGSGEAFSKGREASAYVGLTPRQYTSGGEANIVGLSKRVGNRKLRSVLIQGALANKNVRTAWALVTQGTEYQRRGQLEMAASNVLQTETKIR
ncbi:MAG: IS110 family transposase, partial [Rhodothermales bacterium]|nr:IS110 family transposase [Rhodothermales bacterium]